MTHEPAFPDRLAADQDPSFVFDYRPLDGPAYDTGDDRRLSTYWDVEPLMRGPQPPPGWLVTDRAAVDTELGVLKTGKEADAFLLRRALPDTDGCGLVAKRYRSSDHRMFRRSDDYTAGRRVRDSRDRRAMVKATAHGRAVAAGVWANAEWTWLNRCYDAGVAVPYPVQIDGTELLLELVTAEGAPAPRLADTKPEPGLLAEYFAQLRMAMELLARLGIAHGDLSPYNVLATGERVVLIDLPQAVDLVANPTAADFLLRDCRNVCRWFVRRGLDVDEDALFADLLVAAYG